MKQFTYQLQNPMMFMFESKTWNVNFSQSMINYNKILYNFENYYQLLRPVLKISSVFNKTNIELKCEEENKISS